MNQEIYSIKAEIIELFEKLDELNTEEAKELAIFIKDAINDEN